MKRFLNWFHAAPALFRPRAGKKTGPRVGKPNRWIPQLEALEDRYAPALLGPPVYSSAPNEVTFNFDNRPNYVYIYASFGSILSGSTTYVGFLDSVSGGTTYAVAYQPALFRGGYTPTIVLNMGYSNNNTIQVYSNANEIMINSHGRDAVNVGFGVHTVQDIRNTITVTNPPSYTDVTIDDSSNSAAKTATLSNVIINGSLYSSLTGLAPAAINVHQGDLASLTIRGGSGNDTFTIVDTPFSVTTTLLTGLGNDTIQVQNATGPLVINGGGGTNTLVGPNANTVWQITGTNAGTLNTGVSFSAVQNLVGGSMNDVFQMQPGGLVTGTISGGGGSNTFDYSAYSSSVIVDLQTGRASGVIGGVSGIQNVVGGIGGPPGMFNLLIGAGGGTLRGGPGRPNILVAGGSAATLVGGNQEDLLVAGTTSYDTDPLLLSWLQIANYLAFGGDPFPTQVANLMSGNGVPALNPATVTGNGGGNTLIDVNELALIFTDGKDSLGAFGPGSQWVPITP